MLNPVRLFPTPWTVVHQAPCPWKFPGKSTGVGGHSLVQKIFLTQRLNLSLLHCRQILYHWATGKILDFAPSVLNNFYEETLHHFSGLDLSLLCLHIDISSEWTTSSVSPSCHYFSPPSLLQEHQWGPWNSFITFCQTPTPSARKSPVLTTWFFFSFIPKLYWIWMTLLESWDEKLDANFSFHED